MNNEQRQKDKDIVATYDWCWQCNSYHKDGAKECRPKDLDNRNKPLDQRR